MAKKPCFDCGNEVDTRKDSYVKLTDGKSSLLTMNITDKKADEAKNDDVSCIKCWDKLFCRHAVAVWKYNESVLLPEEFEKMLQCGDSWIPIAKAELGLTQENANSSAIGSHSSTPSENTSQSNERITNANELDRLAQLRHDEFKRQWRKGYTVQFKNDKIAILMRSQGSQVQFIVAFDQVTREGFRLMAIDEGKSVDGGAGFSGGISSYYYFQKMDYVR